MTLDERFQEYFAALDRAGERGPLLPVPPHAAPR